jgi:hypothetical protein
MAAAISPFASQSCSWRAVSPVSDAISRELYVRFRRMESFRSARANFVQSCPGLVDCIQRASAVDSRLRTVDCGLLTDRSPMIRALRLLQRR